MQIKEIMCKNVFTTTRDASVADVAKMLHDYKIHGVPVVDGKHLVGIVTETDFFIKGDVEIYLPSYMDFLTKTGVVANEKGGDENLDEILKAKAGDIMTEKCITLSPEDDVKDFLNIIKEKNVHTVPVAIGDVLVGVVTVADIIKLI